MSVILMTTLFYKALILQGEIWCWSLLGLKELRAGVKERSPLQNKGIIYGVLWLVVGTLRSEDAIAAKTPLKKWLYDLPVFIVIIPTHLLYQK